MRLCARGSTVAQPKGWVCDSSSDAVSLRTASIEIQVRPWSPIDMTEYRRVQVAAKLGSFFAPPSKEFDVSLLLI